MIFGVAKLVSYVSQCITLHPGDVISTGTPPGVGIGRKPPRFLQPGHTMRLEVSGLGQRLFDRSAQGMCPTPAGRELYRLAIDLLDMGPEGLVGHWRRSRRGTRNGPDPWSVARRVSGDADPPRRVGPVRRPSATFLLPQLEPAQRRPDRRQ
jgi:hypothetical protein